MEVLRQLRLADYADILIIAVLTYWMINLIRGTRAVQMLIGLVVVAGMYTASQYFELYTLSWILREFLGSIFLVVVVIFQNDIRRVLTQVGRGRLFGGDRRARSEVVDEVTRAAVSLAAKRIGALIVLEREVGLNEYLEAGTMLDARVSRELLMSVFHPSSPIHDGAAIIRHGRLAAAGCFLPLTANPAVSKSLGSRHRAAIGVTEESDAAVVVVSEEEGKISLVREGRIIRDCDAGTLRTSLAQLSLP
ncbi:MAG TPA: diadenylate cyclase CdaA [Candidatus Binatia bacterium]|nr:diadenylate cyclase CdaA [Candidatus Binatia bacterium]